MWQDFSVLFGLRVDGGRTVGGSIGFNSWAGANLIQNILGEVCGKCHSISHIILQTYFE